ncbi:NACHT, LRR and PYD domains-containing protein 12-like [Ciona intestinalis]
MLKLHEDHHPDVKVAHLFNEAEKNAVKEAARQFSDKNLKRKYIATHSRSVMVAGQAGIGKSTLAMQAARIALSKDEYVVFVKLSEVGTSDVSLVDFIINNAVDNKTVFTEEEKSAVQDLLLTNASLFTLIFDGIDELGFDFKPTEIPKQFSITEATEALNLIKSIMKGEAMQEAKKLWTSRPQHALQIHKDLCPITVMHALGLSDQSQCALGESICGEAKWVAVKKFLDDHPDIQAMCYVPVWCIMTCHVLSSSLDETSRLNISTITQILTTTLNLYIRSSHLRTQEHGNILQLAELAWNGWIDKKVIFEPRDFNRAKVSPEIKEAFVNTALKSGLNFRMRVLQGDRQSSFVHLVWQEFFAALHMCTLPKQSFTEKLQKFNDQHYEMVAKLVYGIFNPVNLDVLHMIFPEAFTECEEKRAALRQFAGGQIWQEGNQENGQLLSVLSWVHESDDNETIKMISAVFPEELNFSTEPVHGLMFTPIDVVSLSYIFSKNNFNFSQISCSNVQFMEIHLIFLQKLWHVLKRLTAWM